MKTERWIQQGKKNSDTANMIKPRNRQGEPRWPRDIPSYADECDVDDVIDA